MLLASDAAANRLTAQHHQTRDEQQHGAGHERDVKAGMHVQRDDERHERARHDPEPWLQARYVLILSVKMI